MNHSLTCKSRWAWLRSAARSAVGCLALALRVGVAAETGQSDPLPPSDTPAVRPVTVDQAVELALLRHPTLQAGRARVDAAAGRVAQAGLWSNPELELNVEEWPVSGEGGFSDSKQTIGVVQTIPFPGKKSLDRQASRAELSVYEAALNVRRAALIRDVKSAFYQVLVAERIVAVGQELVRVSEASATAARHRVDAGALALQEQLRAEIQLEQAKTQLRSFERERDTAREILATILGRPDLRQLPLAGALAETPRADLLDGAPSGWLASHPSMLAAQAAYRNATLAERRARLDPYPDLKMGLAGGRMGDTDQSILELHFSLPLPLLDRSKGRRQEAAAQVEVAQAELEAAQQALQRRWSGTVGRYQVAVEEVSSYRTRILPKADQALHLVQRGFEEGKFNFMDLLDTQRTTAEARLAYQRKLLEMNVAQAELEALLAP